jgi:hypothetical protein
MSTELDFNQQFELYKWLIKEHFERDVYPGSLFRIAHSYLTDGFREACKDFLCWDEFEKEMQKEPVKYFMKDDECCRLFNRLEFLRSKLILMSNSYAPSQNFTSDADNIEKEEKARDKILKEFNLVKNKFGDRMIAVIEYEMAL